MFIKRTPEEKEAEKKALLISKAEQQKREEHYKKMMELEKESRNKEKVAPSDSYISLQHLNKIYANHVQAVYDFNLEIKEKEFIVFVGPSGCGKSTTLRMIAGLEDITYGDLFIDGVYANYLEPKKRNVAMVFQSYALYPHMTVYENMAFGLQVRHVPKKEIEERIKKAAEILQISEYLDRKPKALSGGQCQRVALGRAIVRNSKVFLMDEPLSNLDAKLRVQMRSEIVRLHNELGATTIYVTHDQTEAMTMATRIVVMKEGYVQQIGSPKEIYDNPANTFVATFIGSPAMNIVTATYKNGKIKFENGYTITLPEKNKKAIISYYKKEIDNLNREIEEITNKQDEEQELESKNKKDQVLHEVLAQQLDKKKEEKIELVKTYESYLQTKNHPIAFGIRPEDVVSLGSYMTAEKITEVQETKVLLAELLGNEYYVHFKIGENELIAKIYADRPLMSDDTIKIGFNAEKIHLFDLLSTKHIV